MSYWIAYQTILSKEIRRFMRIWPQTILPAAVTTSLYFLIFGALIGKRIGTMGGVTYMEYIVPGIIMMSVISSSYANVVSSFYSTKFQRNIEELLIAPVPNWVILTGYVSGGVVRGSIVGLLVGSISCFFVDLNIIDYSVTVTIFLCTAVLFALAGFINATFANSFDDISIIPNFVLTPLTYLGGLFYSVDMLPGIWKDISLANPILYIVNAFRYGLLGVSDVDVARAFVIVAATIVVFFGVSLYLLNKGVGIKT